MLQLSNIKRAQCRPEIVIFGIRFLFAMFFLCCITVSPVFSQCNESPTTYSDLWLWSTDGQYSESDGPDYDEENPPTIYVAGAGYIQDPYNSCGHEYYVDYTDVQSPSGRIATGSSSTDLVFDLDETGDFTTSSSYSQFCPIIYRFYSAGSSSLITGIGVSFSTYRRIRQISPTVGQYEPIANCFVRCRANIVTYRSRTPNLPDYVRAAEPYLRVYQYATICTHVAALLRISQPIDCVDIG